MTGASTAAFDAEVVAIEDLSPAFRRITLGGEGMVDFGIPHHPRDQRFKLIIPPDGREPIVDVVRLFADQHARGISWYEAWRRLDPGTRGTMRTYTVRQWHDASRELVVDMVMHTDADGRSGPAAHWARNAVIGSRLQVIGPSRHGEAHTGGIGFRPGNAQRILLVGDETAVPAVASILDHLEGADVCARAILEVPTSADLQKLAVPAHVEVLWLPRDGRPPGSLIVPAVHDTITPSARATSPMAPEAPDFETNLPGDAPRTLTRAAHKNRTPVDEIDRNVYAWIAGEASTVKHVRRYLVNDVGVDRTQVAFMGYWRAGKAEGE